MTDSTINDVFVRHVALKDMLGATEETEGQRVLIRPYKGRSDPEDGGAGCETRQIHFANATIKIWVVDDELLEVDVFLDGPVYDDKS